MDEEYKQSEISKEVQRLMDEEGYEFGEAVKEAMAQGYKNGGLMVAIQKLAQGGMTYGDKTYHQYHDQYVPPDTENMMYANGGGVGSMMVPKVPAATSQLVSDSDITLGYRGDAAYRSGSEQASSIGQGNVGNQSDFGDGPTQSGGGGGGDGPPSVINPPPKD